jgi:hypothetical protein
MVNKHFLNSYLKNNPFSGEKNNEKVGAERPRWETYHGLKVKSG